MAARQRHNNWTNTLGTPNASYSDASFAIFMAAAGKVTDNSLGQVRSGGMQFASDGYRLLGDASSWYRTQAAA